MRQNFLLEDWALSSIIELLITAKIYMPVLCPVLCHVGHCYGLQLSKFCRTTGCFLPLEALMVTFGTMKDTPLGEGI